MLCTGYLQCIILGSVISIISASELGCLLGSVEDCYGPVNRRPEPVVTEDFSESSEKEGKA